MLEGLASAIFLRSPIGDVAMGPIGRIAGDFHVEWSLLFAQTLNFCVVAFLLYRFAFRPLLSVVNERQRRIADGLQYAEEMQSQMAAAEITRNRQLKEAFQQARAIVEEAQSRATAFDKQQRDLTTRKMVRLELQTAQQLRQEQKAAIENAQHAIRGEVVQLAEKILGRELSPELRGVVALERADALIHREK